MKMNEDYTIKLTHEELGHIVFAMWQHIKYCDAGKEKDWPISEHYLTQVNQIRPLYARLAGMFNAQIS